MGENGFDVMSKEAADAQVYNQELVKCLEKMKIQKKIVMNIIEQDENKKKDIERTISSLQNDLTTVKERIEKNKRVSNKYEEIITDTEHGFRKILEASETLLDFTRKQINNLEDSDMRIIK